jgi:hypothetical protein
MLNLESMNVNYGIQMFQSAVFNTTKLEKHYEQ